MNIIKIILTGSIIIFYSNVMAQQMGPKESTTCAFLKNIKFKNGIDTVIIKATFKDAAEMVTGGRIFKTLDKEKKLNSKEFDYQIGFRPENCSKTYYGPANVNKPKLIFGKVPLIGKEVYVKCVAFERREWEDHGVPFFVVIDVTIEKPKH